jgi:hypothetical protein
MLVKEFLPSAIETDLDQFQAGWWQRLNRSREPACMSYNSNGPLPCRATYFQRSAWIARQVFIPRTGQNETFNRYANGVRAHTDGVGVKQPNLSLMAVRGIFRRTFRCATPARSPRRAAEKSQPGDLRFNCSRASWLWSLLKKSDDGREGRRRVTKLPGEPPTRITR